MTSPAFVETPGLNFDWLNLDTELPGPQGRPFPLVDYGTHEIKELF